MIWKRAFFIFGPNVGTNSFASCLIAKKPINKEK